MRKFRALFSVSAAVFATACATDGGHFTGRVRGVVLAKPEVELGEKGTVVISIIKAGPGAPSEPRLTTDSRGTTHVAFDGVGAPRVLSRVTRMGKLDFSLRYDPREIHPGEAYAISAWVLTGGKVAWLSDPAPFKSDQEGEITLTLHPPTLH
jgi:Type III secretion system lipoprotein chaperone (YscW)